VWSVQCVFCAQIMHNISIPVKVLSHIHSHVHFCSQERHCYEFWRLWKNWTHAVVLPLKFSRKDHQWIAELGQVVLVAPRKTDVSVWSLLMVITTFAYSYKDEHVTQYKDYKNYIYYGWQIWAPVMRVVQISQHETWCFHWHLMVYVIDINW